MSDRLDSRNFACILAGGSGERFWPMSRTRTPKHLLRLLSERTLLEETVLRLEGVVPRANTFILTNEAQVAGVREALPFLAAEQIVAEPAKRDTAPAAALATGLVRARCPDGVLALLSADAVIRNTGRFGEQLSAAFSWIRAGSRPGGGGGLLTFAIPPTYPATGFGYLELGREVGRSADGSRFLTVDRFVEKPDAATAETYLKGGRHAWNAGLFVWSADTFIAEAQARAPELAAFARELPLEGRDAFIAARFPGLPKISVDYALMEKASSVTTVLAEFDWDDAGTWTALAKHLPADGSGNAFRGSVVAAGSTGNIAVSNGRTIALCGVRDLVVVETPDAILVCHRDAVQDIKRLHPMLPSGLL